jgi:aspartate carbamoyltransferase
MRKPGRFSGRSIQVVNDLSLDEQWYLYDKARQLKQDLRAGRDVSRFRIGPGDLGLYLMFLESSTRTKESFRNAALFHGIRVNDFNAQASSINKNESITDTVKMLSGYMGESIFVIRSAQEGVCRWLERAIGQYAEASGFPRPGFINAGDGKHEHPTQEFLDEFSFLEHNAWDRSAIHIALVGDLYHGRTVHSKADGLRIFKQARVDLVAPKDIGMPEAYARKMKDNGFKLRTFASIDEYLESGDTAPIWYFTRLQLERMGDAILERADSLRAAVTFRRDMVERLLEGTRFYHPLPRDRVNQTLPTWLDATPLNGWDGQSVNGYFTRVIEIGMLGGAIGDDFQGQERQAIEYADDFVKEVPVLNKPKPTYKIGIKPVENGIVIDHIGAGADIEAIWDRIDKVRKLLRLNVRSSHGVYHNNQGKYKGIISLPDILDLGESDLKKLGAACPGCTLNIIKDADVVKKYRMGMPPRIYNFQETSCKNEACISHPAAMESIVPEFIRRGDRFVCLYCEREHGYEEIWDV